MEAIVSIGFDLESSQKSGGTSEKIIPFCLCGEWEFIQWILASIAMR